MRSLTSSLALIVLLCMVVIPVYGGGTMIAWQQSLGGSGEDFAFSLQPASDGGYIVVGDTTSKDGDITTSYGMRDVWIVKIGPGGEKEWRKTIGGSMDDHASCVERLSDGTYLISGFTWSTDGDFSDNPGPYAIWNMQIDDGGNILWIQCLPARSSSFVVDGKETPDGGMIMIGQSYTDPLDPAYHGGYDVLVVKSDRNATIEWEQLLGGSGDDFGDNILPVPGGGYLAIGYTNSHDGDVSGNHGSYDAWLLRLDDAGRLLWERCIGGSLYDEGREIIVTPEGQYAAIGFTNSNDGDISGNHGSFDYWWAMVSPDGTILGQQCFGGSGYDHAYDIEMTPDRDFIMLGVSYSDDGDVTYNHGNGDYWVIKFDRAGKVIWQKSFGGSELDIGECLKPDPFRKGRFTLAGSSYSCDGDVTLNRGLADYWVVQIDVPMGLAADFSVAPETGTAPLTVRFTDQSTGDPSSFTYEFGDGFRTMGANPSYTYRRPGVYNVTLTVSRMDPVRKTIVRDSITKPGCIVVASKPPITLAAGFTAYPLEGIAPLNVRFTDQSTGDPANYLYEFGDGYRSTVADPEHTFTKPGTYTVTLTVSKIDPVTKSMVRDSMKRDRYIVAGAPVSVPLVANFSAEPLNGTAPLTVRFTDQSTGDPVYYLYEFGDGYRSTIADPVHSYTNAGTYTVNLTVRKIDPWFGKVVSNTTIGGVLVVVDGQ